MSSWGERTIEYDEMFKKMEEWFNEESRGDQQIYLTGHGSISAIGIRNWIRVLSMIGNKLMNFANGIAVMHGRRQPKWEDFVQAGYLLDTGRMVEIFDKPSDNFGSGILEMPSNQESDD